MADYKITHEELVKIVEELSSFSLDDSSPGVQHTPKSFKADSEFCINLVDRLHSNGDYGICDDENSLKSRVRAFGSNKIMETQMSSWFEMFVESFEDTTLRILIALSFVSLVIGVFENPTSGWIEGVAILTAVLIVAVVTATNNYAKESKFRKLNTMKDNFPVLVRRYSNHLSNTSVRQIRAEDVVVGDIVLLEGGSRIPADGLVLVGSDLHCNESMLTGESHEVEKVPIGHETTGESSSTNANMMLSGCEVTSGQASMIVIAVGADSYWGKIRSKLVVEVQDTPLQKKLDDIADLIGKIGMGAAALTCLAFIWIRIWNPEYTPMASSPHSSLIQFIVQMALIALTIVVVAVPEGLPLAVTISLAYSTQRMMHDQNLVRDLSACETMGNATVLCVDKTGTLTENEMTVVSLAFGTKVRVIKLSDGPVSNDESLFRASDLPLDLFNLLVNGICLNTTANLEMSGKHGDGPIRRPHVLGNKTEGALLWMLLKDFGVSYQSIRHDGLQFHRGDRIFSFSSARKRMSVIIMSSAVPRLYCKGGAEVVIECCSYYIDADGKTKPMTADVKRSLIDTINSFSKSSLRTIALAHRDLTSLHKSPKQSKKSKGEKKARKTDDDDNIDLKSMISDIHDSLELEREMTLDCIVGIKDPLRVGVADAVETCHNAGIEVKMITGDNLITAVAYGRECGILSSTDHVALEGPEFRKMSPKDLDKIIPKLKIVARSTPEDKLKLVCRLNGAQMPSNKDEWEVQHPKCSWEKEKDKLLPGYLEEWTKSRLESEMDGDIVGVTGDGTNDGPALRAADVGLSMGLSGTEIAKEASDIVIMDDNFSSIVKAVTWGRCVYDNIRKFLQFQLTVNIVALTITFFSAITGISPPLNPVMMLWVNLIMDTMGALALGTEAPTDALLQRRPYKRSASLISRPMWRNIISQAVFQILLLAVLLRGVVNPFGLESGSAEHVTFIFNTFVFCQIFNEFNCRHLDTGANCNQRLVNVFKGLDRNPIFVGIIFFTCIVQYLLVEYGGSFTHTVSLPWDIWMASVALPALTLPWGFAVRILFPVVENLKDFVYSQDHGLGKKGGKGSSAKSSEKENLLSKMVLLSVNVACVAVAYKFGVKLVN